MLSLQDIIYQKVLLNWFSILVIEENATKRFIRITDCLLANVCWLLVNRRKSAKTPDSQAFFSKTFSRRLNAHRHLAIRKFYHPPPHANSRIFQIFPCVKVIHAPKAFIGSSYVAIMQDIVPQLSPLNVKSMHFFACLPQGAWITRVLVCSKIMFSMLYIFLFKYLVLLIQSVHDWEFEV